MNFGSLETQIGPDQQLICNSKAPLQYCTARPGDMANITDKCTSLCVY